MTTLPTTELNALADFTAARWTYLSLHTADPGTTGASEATGGSPAYARVVAAPGAASAGVVTFGNVTFNVPGNTPGGSYTHIGGWSAATGGTFRGGDALNTPVTVSPQGTVTVSGFTLAVAPVS